MHITLSVLSCQKEIRIRAGWNVRWQRGFNNMTLAYFIVQIIIIITIKHKDFCNNTNFVPHKLCNTRQRISGEFHENCQNDTEWISHCLKRQNYFLMTVEKQEGFVFHQLRCLAPTLPPESMNNHTILRFWIINWKKRILIKPPHTLHMFFKLSKWGHT